MKYKISIIFLLLILIISFLIFNKKDNVSNNEKTTIKIGVIYPLSGTFSGLSNAHKIALKLALEDIDVDSLKYEYKLIIEDNQFDNKKTAAIASKMVNADKVDAIFSIDSNSGNVLNAILRDKEIFMTGWMSDIKIAERELSFPYGGYIEYEAIMMAEKLQEKDLDKVNLFVSNDNFHGFIESSIDKVFPKYNITVNKFHFNPGEKDFRTIISKSKNTKAQINILATYSPAFDILLKQMIELGVNLPITSLEDFAYVIEKSPLENQWFIMSKLVNDKKFIDRIEKATGDSNTYYSELTYEIFKRFIESCEKSPLKEDGKINIKAVANNLLNSKYINSDIIGKFEIMPNGFIATPLSWAIIRNGQVETLE